MNLNSITPSERSQTQRAVIRLIAFIQYLEKAKLEGEIGFIVARSWRSEEIINYRESTGNFWEDGNVL